MMSKVLAKLENKFPIPVEKRKPAKFTRKPRSIKHPIPKEFSSIFHFIAAPEPEPVTVPDQYPTVDWSAVRFKPALPNPEACPVNGVAQDSGMYMMKKAAWDSNQYSVFTSGNPFGTLPGYFTTRGVVSVPVQGHIYCPDSNRWVLHTSLGTEGPAGGSRRGRKGERGK